MNGWNGFLGTAAAVLLMAWLPFSAAHAQASADDLQKIRQDLEALKEGQEAIQGQLKALLDALREATAPEKPKSVKGIEMMVEGPMVMGRADAKVVMVEFSDFQCPFCRRHVLQTIPSLKKDYIDTGKIRYAFRDYPIPQIHPAAAGGHLAARCAGDQGKYWAYHDRLFDAQKDMSKEALQGHAKALDMDLAVFDQCLDESKHANAVRADVAEGQKLGVRGTPTFFLGIVDPDDSKKIKLVESIRGAYPYPTFKRAIDDLLAEKKG